MLPILVDHVFEMMRTDGAPASPETSTGGGERELPLANHLGRVAQRLADVLDLKISEGGQDLGLGHPTGDHADHARDRDTQASETRDTPIWSGRTAIRVNVLEFTCLRRTGQSQRNRYPVRREACTVPARLAYELAPETETIRASKAFISGLEDL